MTQSFDQRPLIGCTTYRKESGDKLPLLALRPAYVDAVIAAGGLPVLIPLGLAEADLRAILSRVDGLLIPGGGDIDPVVYHGRPQHPSLSDIDPDRDRVEFELLRTAVKEEKPFFAICRGHQVLNVALGGTLWEDIASFKTDAIRHDYYYAESYPRNHRAHPVQLSPNSHISRRMNTTEVMVNSLHHQGIRDLAPELTAVAHASDGLVEGIEVSGHPFGVSVQWHPEDLIHEDPAMLALFRGLVETARRR